MMRHLAIVREIHTGSDHAGQETRVGAIEALEHPEAALEQDVVRMGWRECSVSGCPCRAFVQSYGSDLCGNCGHNYTDHF